MRYYLNIPVPADLSERVSAFEQKWQGTSKSAPHITLVIPRLILPGSSEADLVSQLESALSTLPAFPIRMLGLDYFGNKTVIHIPVDRSAEFALCHETAMDAVEGILEPPTGEHASISHPHITLATKLSPEKGERAWQEALTQDWSGDFVCNRVQLLRIGPRDPHWIVVATLPFQSRA
ncbi:MAG: 2-5 ligase superfamily [Chthonomonadaceae bacterium]|nr:2-5 ligase superfamily [Chthonomonadaceae bacterium]